MDTPSRYASVNIPFLLRSSLPPCVVNVNFNYDMHEMMNKYLCAKLLSDFGCSVPVKCVYHHTKNMNLATGTPTFTKKHGFSYT